MIIFRFKILVVVLILVSAMMVNAQSTKVEFPTPITSDSISGVIKARDVGDSRSTVHYYVFEAVQGDTFLKIEAFNLNGDIDVFYADNLRPLTKISLYADSTPTQTGREIYLRKPEKLILKVEGRTPTDDPATYSIKFEGSFKRMEASKQNTEEKIPELEVKADSDSEVKVNSVGTIIEVKPKPTPKPKTTVARNNSRKTAKSTTTPEPVSTISSKSGVAKTKAKSESLPSQEEKKKVEVVITDDLPKKSEVESPETAKEPEKPKTTKKKTTSSNRKTSTKKNTTVKTEVEPKPTKPSAAEELAQALENVKLVVEFKDGARIERPMNEVLRFGVDKGILTIVNKNGTIGRYSILEISKISVE